MSDKSVIDEIRKKVLIDLFITPYALFPFIGGCSLLMLAWATKAFGLLAFGGFIGCVFGVGFALTNFILNVSSLSEKAIAKIKSSKIQLKNQQLDQLAKKLTITREVKNWELKKDDDYLINLRVLYEKFVSDLENSNIEVTPEIIVQVDQIFEECVQALEHSFELYQTAGTMAPAQRKLVLAKRGEVLKEIDESVKLLADLMVQVRTVNTKDKNFRLAKLRGELRSNLNAAELTSERMLEIEHGDQNNFDEYLKD